MRYYATPKRRVRGDIMLRVAAAAELCAMSCQRYARYVADGYKDAAAFFTRRYAFTEAMMAIVIRRAMPARFPPVFAHLFFMPLIAAAMMTFPPPRERYVALMIIFLREAIMPPMFY